MIHNPTIFVTDQGVAVTNRIFFIHAAVEQIQATGYLDDSTLNSLSRDEYVLVMERARSKDNN